MLELVICPDDIEDIAIRGMAEQNPLHVDILLRTSTRIADFRPSTVQAALNTNGNLEALVRAINEDAYLTLSDKNSPHELEIKE